MSHRSKPTLRVFVLRPDYELAPLLETAEQIARDFILRQRPRAEVTVSGSEKFESDTWKIVGRVRELESDGSGSTSYWTVHIKGNEISAWEMTSGPSVWIDQGFPGRFSS